MLLGEERVGPPVRTAVLECGAEAGVEVVQGSRARAGREAHARFEEPQAELPVLAARREALVVGVREERLARERGVRAREVEERPPMAVLAPPAIVVLPPGAERQLPRRAPLEDGRAV